MDGLGALLMANAFGPAQQDSLLQARAMQAMSFAVHIPLVCFAITLPAIVVWTEWRYRRTGDRIYITLARRWSKLMAFLFGVGVVTGTALSFELGALWPNFMATFAGIFGAAFFCEGFSFFLEAIFIGIYIYGWDRFSPRLHLLSGIPMIVAGFSGSLFVISVNGWMNHPVGFTIKGGMVTSVDPARALFGNPFFWHELIHMYLAGVMTTGFLMAGGYAWGWLRGRRTRYHRIALAITFTIAALASPVEGIVGDWSARTVASEQPVKMAVMEGIPRTTAGAPETVFGWYNGSEVVGGIQIPDLLSILAFHSPQASVRGLNSVKTADQPPVAEINVVRFAYQIMVGIGLYLAGLSAVAILVYLKKRRLPRGPWFHRAVVLAGPLSLTAVMSGWVTTEVGRQPWIVYGLMRTSQAVTGAKGIPVGLGVLAAVYAGLLLGVVYFLRRLSRTPVDLGAVGASE